MLNYTLAHTEGETDRFLRAVEGVTPTTLRAETHRLYNLVRDVLAGVTDADVAFVPYDPVANDPYAASEAEQHIGWTLGHLVVHTTATMEECAVFSSILARGVEAGGRLRYETPWETVTTVAQCWQRLEESRRLVLAYLEAWPDAPHLDVLRQFNGERVQAFFGRINAIASYGMGLAHLEGHIEQFNEVRRQALAAREGVAALS